MSRQESPREDLLREATALVERVELRLPGQTESMVAGFRKDGSASIFFGDSPVYQFNSRGEFRRGFRDGLLYKAEDGRLVEMRRQRSEDSVELRSRVLSEDECAAMIVEAVHHLETLRDNLSSGRIQAVGCVPIDVDVAERVLAWLQQLHGQIVIARSSRVS